MFTADLLSRLLQKPTGMVFVFWSIPQQVRNGESWKPWYMTKPPHHFSRTDVTYNERLQTLLLFLQGGSGF